MIITVDPDRTFHRRVLAAVAGAPWASVAYHVEDPEQAPAVVAAHGVAAVVVVGPQVSVNAATTLTQRLVVGPVPAFVLLVTEPTNDVLRSAMRAGARDVLPVDFDPDDLRAAVERTGLSEAERATRGLTVAVFSTKGGVGTSTIAANLVARFADRIDAETVLIDLDVASADQSIMHALTPQWTLQDLADGTIGTDLESMRGVLQPMDGTMASILPGPLDPALAETISGDAVTRVIGAARAISPVLVLDTASSFDDRTLAAIDTADIVVVVSSLDVAALRALTVSLQTLARIGVPADSIRVALVRADSRSGLQVMDVERAIGRAVDVRIPSSRAVVRSLNEGVPLAITSPRSVFAQCIDELIDGIIATAPRSVRDLAAAAEARSGRWFGFGRGRSAGDDADDDDGPTKAVAEPAVAIPDPPSRLPGVRDAGTGSATRHPSTPGDRSPGDLPPATATDPSAPPRPSSGGTSSGVGPPEARAALPTRSPTSVTTARGDLWLDERSRAVGEGFEDGAEVRDVVVDQPVAHDGADGDDVGAGMESTDDVVATRAEPDEQQGGSAHGVLRRPTQPGQDDADDGPLRRFGRRR